MAFVYIQSERQLWTVGHYDGNGKFQPESDHGSPDAAAARAVALNGGGPTPADTLRVLQLARVALESQPSFRINALPRELDSSYKVLRELDRVIAAMTAGAARG
jgi:hypothetical protein